MVKCYLAFEIIMIAPTNHIYTDTSINLSTLMIHLKVEKDGESYSRISK